MKALHIALAMPWLALLMAGSCEPTEGDAPTLDPCVATATCGGPVGGGVGSGGDLADRDDVVDDGLAVAADVRGVYLDRLDRVLASPTETDALLAWLAAHRFTGVSAYDLGTIFDSPSLTDALARFIVRARREAGVVDVAAVRGDGEGFAAVVDYNRRVPLAARFDVFTLEHEWWNGAGTFRSHTAALDRMAALAGPDIVVDDYIGWFMNPGDEDGDGVDDVDAAGMARALVARTDRLMVHAYRAAPDLDVLAARLRLLSAAAGDAGRRVDVIVIFSAEEAFMGPYFQTHTFDEAWRELEARLAADPSTHRDLRVLGTQLFAASHARRVRP